jgi:hypothetical protein
MRLIRIRSAGQGALDHRDDETPVDNLDDEIPVDKIKNMR